MQVPGAMNHSLNCLNSSRIFHRRSDPICAALDIWGGGGLEPEFILGGLELKKGCKGKVISSLCA